MRQAAAAGLAGPGIGDTSSLLLQPGAPSPGS
jgi:hypothetical protein